MIFFYLTPLPRAECDKISNSKQMTADLNLEFSLIVLRRLKNPVYPKNPL